MQWLDPRQIRAESLLDALADIPVPSVDAVRVLRLLERCPSAGRTPLIEAPALAARAGIGRLSVKDERGRMGLGSFKALGAAYVIACDAEDAKAQGRTYATASAGNHGLSVAAGAAAFGARAIVYLSETVPESFAARLAAQGAEVRRRGADYEASMKAAMDDAKQNGWDLLSDSSWAGYVDRPHRLMEGYLAVAHEIVEQMDHAPTHVFLQAGVGGMAAALAAYMRAAWGEAPRIVIVEPEAAPAIHDSMAAGKPLKTSGPVSAMGRLDCKEPSLIALKGLARDAHDFVTVSEAEGAAGAAACGDAGLPTTPSGAAGIAALLSAGAHRAALGLDPQSRALAILTEEADG